MNNRIVGLIGLLLFWAGNLLAQNYAFKVLAVKGNVTLDSKPVKVGAIITDNQTLVVKEGSYLSLAHHSGKAIEVAPGTHKAKDLSARISSGNNSVTDKYIKFVVNELTQEDPEASTAARNRFQHMNKTGSVERDIAVSAVRTWLPLNSKLLGDQLLIKWSNVNPQPEELYEVKIFDLSEQLLFSKQTKEHQLLVDLAREKIANQSHLIVKVLPLDPTSGKARVNSEQLDGNVVIRLDAVTSKKLEAELLAIRKEFGEKSAIGKLAEANFFEENGFISEAIIAYEQALLLSGNASQYEALYKDFLTRNDFHPTKLTTTK